MRTHHRLSITACLLILGLGLGLNACGTEPLSTRSFEEKYLSMGEAQELYRQGHDMLRNGRYREALTAFSLAEQRAHTDDLRAASRIRRLWLEDVLAAYERGDIPPAPPVVVRDPALGPTSPDLPGTVPETLREDDLPPLPPPPAKGPEGGYASPPPASRGIRETPLY